MNRIFLKTSIGIISLIGLVGVATGAVTANLKQLSGHVPSVVANLAPASLLPATNQLQLAIGLPLRNVGAMETLLEQINDPSSANYHHYLTPDQFTAQFGPTEDDYRAVAAFAKANGLTVTHTHENRMVLGVSGKVADVQNSFHVTLNTYHHPLEARDFYAPSAEPSVAASLPILTIQGLSSYSQPHPLLTKHPISSGAPANGSGPLGGFIGNDFRNAYVPGSPLNGAGQIVGLLQFDGYFPGDITNYEALAGLPNVPLQNVLLDGFSGVPGANNGEVCLDIETVISMAPGLSKVVVFEAPLNGIVNDLLSSMVASNQIKQFSASWAYEVDATSDQIFKQMALQGQTFLNASGDGDAWVGGIPLYFNSCEDPYITLVGGTTLTMNGFGAGYASETVWNWGLYLANAFNPDNYWGSSGGISTRVPIPKWQQGISMLSNKGSTTLRNSPDVSLTADNVFVVHDGGQQDAYGGTSCASPLWAGFMALVNQQAATNGQPPVGFLAPAAYAIAKTVGYTNYFHDVVTGNNAWPRSGNNFNAVPGYDLCTGLGTPNGTNFINAILGMGVSNGPVILAPAAPWGNYLTNLNGSNPNGAWFLFVQDDQIFDVGIISNGWSLALTTANPVGYAADNQLYVTPATVTNLTNGFWTVNLAVTNFGPSDSAGVMVVDTIAGLGLGVTLASTNLTQGTVTNFGNRLTWTVGDLPVNAGASLNLNFLVLAAGSYTNSAYVQATTYDPNPDDDGGTSTATAQSASLARPVLTPNFLSGGAGGGFQLTVNNVSGQSVIIEVSTNLVAGSWVPVFTNVQPFVFTNFNSTNYPMQFYRARTGP